MMGVQWNKGWRWGRRMGTCQNAAMGLRTGNTDEEVERSYCALTEGARVHE